MAIKSFMHTEPGGGKRDNEDFVIARFHPAHPDCLICVLADGQGGQSHGAAAARAASETAWNLAAVQHAGDLVHSDAWLNILRTADTAAAATGGYSTLVAFACAAGTVRGASSGDSKVFIGGAGGQMIELTKHQRKNPPAGSGEAFFEIFHAESEHGTRLLAATDGVWKYCGYEAIGSALTMPYSSGVTDMLRNAVIKNGGPLPDDFSLISIVVG